MKRLGAALGLLALTACAYGSPGDEGGTVPDKVGALLAADAGCQKTGRFASVRYVDHARNTIFYDCMDTRNRFPIASTDLRGGIRTPFR